MICHRRLDWRASGPGCPISEGVGIYLVSTRASSRSHESNRLEENHVAMELRILPGAEVLTFAPGTVFSSDGAGVKDGTAHPLDHSGAMAEQLCSVHIAPEQQREYNRFQRKLHGEEEIR